MTTCPRNRPLKLETRAVSKSFDGRVIFSEVSLRILEGEIVSLLGSSGCGKTTLFNVIAGLLAPDSGQVFLGERDITECPGNVSYMLQKDLLLPYRTLRDNVALPLLLRGEKKAVARAQAVALFTDFGLAGTELLYPAQLSGGMRQRAALLRTYLFSRELALLDEPFSALDALTRSGMHNWYMDVMERIQLTTLFITHDIDEALLLSDRVLILAGNPAKIEAEITIPVPRPRHSDFKETQIFLDARRAIVKALDFNLFGSNSSQLAAE